MTGPWVLGAPRLLRGEVRVPGDKSISHRGFLLGALGSGRGEVSGCNQGLDVASTRSVLRSLGVAISRHDDGGAGSRWIVRGAEGRLKPPGRALDCGNSGTTLRLLAGLMAAQPFTTTLDGDASLRSRPMARIAKPLRTMGARVEGHDGGRTPPLVITGGDLQGGEFELPMASAQVKSCILLAAAAEGLDVVVHEPGASRDHTERLLAAMNADIEATPGRVALRKGAPLVTVDVAVPGDPSAAALLAAAALVVPESDVRLTQVGLNPTRTAFLSVLQRMGAKVLVESSGSSGGEERGTLVVRGAEELVATEIAPQEIPGLVDEVPALAVVAAFARGTTRFRAVAELRVKESDRLASTCRLLSWAGIDARAEGDDLLITGGVPTARGRLPQSDDHRIVMAGVALVLGALAGQGGDAVEVPDDGPADVSFPGYRGAIEEIALG